MSYEDLRVRSNERRLLNLYGKGVHVLRLLHCDIPYQFSAQGLVRDNMPD